MLLSTFFLAVTAVSVTAIPYIKEEHAIVGRAGGVCNSGVYGELSPYLKSYQPALVFCSAIYPICTTARPVRRQPYTTPAAPNARATPLVATAAAIIAQNARVSAYAKGLRLPGKAISTLCSCIETPTPCKVTTPMTTPSMTTTTAAATTEATTTTETQPAFGVKRRRIVS